MQISHVKTKRGALCNYATYSISKKKETYVFEEEIVCFNRDLWLLTASSKLPVLFRLKMAMFSADLVTLS